MKATGIVRKIDDLGRIVIPKEIRGTLNIKDGEDIEIFIEEDKIILKKYYKLLSVKEESSRYIKIFEKITDYKILITDREKIIINTKNTFLEKEEISEELHNMINERKTIIVKECVNFSISKNKKDKISFIFVPIIINTDVVGSIIIYNEKELTEQEISTAEVISLLLKSEIE